MRSRTSLALAALALGIWVFPGAASAQHWQWHDTHEYCGHHTVPAGRPLDVRPGMGAHAFDVAVAGDVRCRDVTGGRCRGFVYHHPVELVVRHPSRVQIDVSWASVDTVMALVGPSGSFSDDNGGHGDLSRLDVYLEPGVHYLYIGTRHRRHVGHATVVVDADPVTPPRVVVVPSRPSPPHVVHVPSPPPRVIVVDDHDHDWDDDDHHRGRRGRGHGRGHDD